jgi:hypothetical protein
MIVQASPYICPHTCIAVNISNVIFLKFLENSLKNAYKLFSYPKNLGCCTREFLNQYFQTGGERIHLTVFGNRTRSGAASYSSMYLV